MAFKCGHCGHSGMVCTLLHTRVCEKCGQQTNEDGTPAPEKRRFFLAADQARFEENRKRFGEEEALRISRGGSERSTA